jgi:hypothetical protein
MKKPSKSTKSTKLGIEQPSGSVDFNTTEHPVHAAQFSDKHIPAWSFDMLVRQGDSWLTSGASLLRASHAVMRQCLVDGSQLKATVQNWKPGDEDLPSSPASLHLEVLLLAAFALENALKAVIAATLVLSPPPNPPSGELPPDLKSKGHDLLDLAARVSIAPNDNHEEEALKRGQNFTEWLGRYPTPVAHDEHHSGLDIPDLRVPLAAYERLFFRCVEAVARLTCQRFRNGTHKDKDPEELAAEERARYERAASAVDPLPPGTDAGRMGFGLRAATITTG